MANSHSQSFFMHPQTTTSIPLDYVDCPQYSQKFLSQHPELHFCGIFDYIFKMSNNVQNLHEIQMVCSSFDEQHRPVNALMKDDSVFYKTGTPKSDQFLGVHFFCIKVRPSAICIKSANLPSPYKNQVLRSFIIAGKEEEQGTEPVILQEFAYTDKLKKGGSDIFYLNTDKFFKYIYIQQTTPSFDNEMSFIILQFEVHGEIMRV